MYYFVRITPANALYALWLSLRKPVAAWKVELPSWLGRRFGRVKPYRVLTRDEWLLAHDRVFDVWKAQALPSLVRRHRHTAAVGERQVDFSRNVWQLLGIDFEALGLFAEMLEKSVGEVAARVVVEPRIASAFEPGELEALFPNVRFRRSIVNRALEQLHEWLISAAHLGRQVVHFGMAVGAGAKLVGRRKIAWLGISPQEIPSAPDRLDFAWPVEHGHARADDIVFFLPAALTPAQRSFLDARAIAYVEPADSFAVLSSDARLRAIGRAFTGFIAALSKPAAVAPLLARFAARAPHWDALFTELGTTTYVTTTSYSWPEKPELAVATARGIRTIIWAYSANSLQFSIESPEFRDVGVLRSIVVAGEFWVWNAAYAEWLRNRAALEGEACDVRLVGALMCGDSAWLERDPREARAKLGLPLEGVCIGVFDMPPASDAWRDQFGGGPPMIDMETYVAFWEIVEAVVLRVPGAYALVKLKRDFTHPWREFPDYIRELLDDGSAHVKSGRVRVVDVNVDPYLPVAACDVALGIAYTSPVLAALAAGKPGYYLDPLGLANHPSHADYGVITLRTVDEAVQAVLAARDAGMASAPAAPGVMPPRATFPLQAAPDASREPRESNMIHQPGEQLA